MSNDNQQVKIDLYKQQFDRLSTWSQFYHDAEIKVNTSSIVISAIAAIGSSFGNKLNICIPYADIKISVVAFLIVISSISALISTIGYCRYYEFCDIYAKKFRAAIFNDAGLKEELRSLQSGADDKFRLEYRVLSCKWLENAHHAVWIVAQIALQLLGFSLILVKIP